MRCTAAARPEGYSWLDLLDESYNRFAWHGPNLTQALRGVDATQANWRPPSAEAMPWNIAEIARHVEDVMRHCGFSLVGRTGGPLLGEIQRTFPLPDALDEVWTNLIGLLDEPTTCFWQAVSETTLARLAEMSPSLYSDRKWHVLQPSTVLPSTTCTTRPRSSRCGRDKARGRNGSRDEHYRGIRFSISSAVSLSLTVLKCHV